MAVVTPYAPQVWTDTVTPADAAHMTTIENALASMVRKPGGLADGEAPVWDATSGGWERSSVKKIAKSSLDFSGANGLVNADVAAAAAIARSKLDFGTGLVDADIAAAAGIAKTKLAALNIANADVAAAAAIVGSKLLPARVATTVAGLGTASDGALGRIRYNSDRFVDLIYDATYGKWVSAPQTVIATQSIGVGNYGYTRAVGGATTDYIGATLIPNYDSLVAAGLTPQVRVTAMYQRNASVNCTFSVDQYHYDAAGGSAALASASGATLVATVNNTWLPYDTGWFTPAANPGSPKAFLFFSWNLALAGAVTAYAVGTFQLRWVA